MKPFHHLAISLAVGLLVAMPVLPLNTTSVFAHQDARVVQNYATIKAALKAELDEVNAQLQTAGIQDTVRKLEEVVKDARAIELRYRAAVDAGKTPAECQVIAIEWGELFQPVSDLQSKLTNDLGMTDNQIEQKLDSLKAVPSLYGKDKSDIEDWLKPYRTVAEINSRANAYINPIYLLLLTAPRGPNVTDAEVETYFNNELVRILNARKAARE